MVPISDEILSKFSVSDENRERIQRVIDYDLSFLTDAFNDNLIRGGRPYSVEQVYPIIARFGKADHEIAMFIAEEFRRFVALTLLKPGVPHAPPGAVDMFWHFFILHTEQYHHFCEEVWGSFQGDPKYRHHYPSNDETRPGQFQAYAETRKLYVEVFGEPKDYERPGATPVPVWTRVVTSADGSRGQGSDISGDSYSGIIDPILYAEGRDNIIDTAADGA